MSLCPFEKIAVDALDKRTLRQLSGLARGGRNFWRAAGLGGRAIKFLGRQVIHGGGRIMQGTQWLGDQLVRHPSRTLAAGVPLGAGLYTLPGRFDRAINNVSPENYYRYY